MKIFNHSFDCEKMISPVNNSWNFYPYNEYKPKEMCFFDIETTGLSPQTSNIYLIGAGYYEKNKFKVIQWFADDYDSEKKMLMEFLSFITSFKILFQYNGNSFDIPYIKWKCERHKVDCSVFNDLIHIDLFSVLRKYGTMLGLENKKLISFEKYVGLKRDDKFNGGELIEVYSEYMQNHFMSKETDMLLNLLLLHNCEDITGLSNVAVLMFLKDFNKLPISFLEYEKSKNSYIIVKYKCFVPYEISIMINETIECICKNGIISLFIPVYKKSLKYYFNDYKDYYYLIEEESVMHKSIAQYTDPSVRRKAKKQECYVISEGMFIPVRKYGCFSKDYHIFKEDYVSKEYFISIDDVPENAKTFFETYFSQLF